MLRLTPLRHVVRSIMGPCSYRTTSSLITPKKVVPKEWRIIETSPGGLERNFWNKKTGQETWYTPEGMTAAEILEVPGARKYWSSVQDVEEYMKQMAEEKSRSGGRDIED